MSKLYFDKGGNTLISLDAAKKIAEKMRFSGDYTPQQFSKCIDELSNRLVHADVAEFKKSAEKVQKMGWPLDYALTVAMQYKKIYREPILSKRLQEVENCIKPQDLEKFRDQLYWTGKNLEAAAELAKGLGMGKKRVNGGY
ncbi:MAG: hypothetical protein NWF00_05295 [Candidatus Bathyarchaeota archaeon]|nr:hypothetical protein [Candidatus Bathyarchaeota archaeon]